MEQIVNNIVGSAVKYTPAGGSIRVLRVACRALPLQLARR
jgi:signal transduction histidine kinase